MSKTMKNLLRPGLLTAALFFAAISASAQTYNLNYNYEANKDYIYNITVENKMTQEVMGQEMTFNSTMKSVAKMESIGKNENGNLMFTFSLDSATVKTSSPMGDTTIVLNDVVGKRIKLELSPKGKIVKREVIDSVSGNFMTGSQVNRETINLLDLPDNEINIGDTWTVSKSDSIENAGGVFINSGLTTNKLVGKDDYNGCECLTVEFSSDMNIEGSGSMQGFDYVAEGSGKSTGTAYFNYEKGVLNGLVQKVELQMTLAGTGQQNMIIPITQEMTTSFKLK